MSLILHAHIFIFSFGSEGGTLSDVAARVYGKHIFAHTHTKSANGLHRGGYSTNSESRQCSSGAMPKYAQQIAEHWIGNCV